MHSIKNFSSIKRILSIALCMAMIICMLPILESEVEAANGYDMGYPAGMAGSGNIVAHGVDVSAWQESGLNFQNIRNAGYTFVILRCGTSYGKDRCFEEYYANAKAAGLNVGCYFYSYALSGAAAQKEANDVLSWIAGKTFEYPVYFDFEDPTQMNLSGTVSAQICRGFMDVMRDNGYLAGLYSLSWVLSQSWVTTSGIRDTYEGWVAHVYSDANNTGITSGQFNIYKDRYASVYGMHQYSFTTYINGVGAFDANVSYKDYPTLVKTYGFNGYGSSWVEQAAFDPMVYRDRHTDLWEMTDLQLRDHWRTFGIKEGRASSPILDLKYYRDNNPDLKAAYGDDFEALYEHFITTGYKEKRKSSPLFDGKYYTERYPEAEEKYGEDYMRYYVEHGILAGHRPSLNFDPDYYWFIYPSVWDVWPAHYQMCAKHFAGHGIREGITSAYDSEDPVISNITVSNVSSKGYTITCTVTDNWEIEYVSFPTWTDKNGQDDLAKDFINTQQGTKNGNVYTFRVNASDHNNETGEYITHIYVQDKGENIVTIALDSISVQDASTKITLKASSTYVKSGNVINKAKASTKVSDFLKQFENQGLKVKDAKGTSISGSTFVGTGAVIELYNGTSLSDTAYAVVLGDIDGNGIIDGTDYLRVKTAFIGSLTLDKYQKLAADVDASGYIDSTDYIRIKGQFLGSFQI